MVARKSPAKKRTTTKRSKASITKAGAKRSATKKSAPRKTSKKTARKATAKKVTRKSAPRIDKLIRELIIGGGIQVEFRDHTPAAGRGMAASTPRSTKCRYSIEFITKSSSEVNLYKWNPARDDYDFVGQMSYAQALAEIKACKEG
jgi:hypothetical protein